MEIVVPDPDLEMVKGGRGGGWGRSSRPLDKGAGDGLPKTFFRPFGPQFGRNPPGPSPGSATEV